MNNIDIICFWSLVIIEIVIALILSAEVYRHNRFSNERYFFLIIFWSACVFVNCFL